MTQYLVSVWHAATGPDLSPEQMQQSFKDVDALNAKLQQAGVWVFAGGLHNPASATVVKASGSDVLVTDGPYVETKESIGGFWILDCPDLDSVLDWAKQATVACRVPVEVRPFHAEDITPEEIIADAH